MTKNRVLNMRHAAWDMLARGRTPGQLILQVTTHCNATCPQCEMRSGSGFTRGSLPRERAYELIEAGAKRGIHALSFTGGEPFLMLDEVLDMAQYAHDLGYRYIRTGTNGYFCMNSNAGDFNGRIRELAEKIAASPIRNLWISLDSADPQTHETMRGLPGVVKGIGNALPLFQEYGIYPAANLGITRMLSGEEIERGLPPDICYERFRCGFEAFYNRAIDLGFTTVNACYPMSVQANESGLQAAYGASSAAGLVTFTGEEKIALFRALHDTIPKYRSKLRIFTPRTSLLALIRQLEGSNPPPRPCRGGVDYFYVDAIDGLVYPCGFRGSEGTQTFPEAPVDIGCTACDWECFRDPSEFAGTLQELHCHPLRTIAQLGGDHGYRNTLMEDVRYYMACGFFNGCQPPDWSALNHFK